MAKYASFKYGDGTKYGILVAIKKIIELFASTRSFALVGWPRGFTLIALRRTLAQIAKARPTRLIGGRRDVDLDAKDRK